MATEMHVRRTISLSNFAHEDRTVFLRSDAFEKEQAKTVPSKTDQIAKSMGLMSGFEGSHIAQISLAPTWMCGRERHLE